MATEYRWQDGEFVRFDRSTPGELLVADSWRSEGGRVAAFAYHVARFEDAVGHLSPMPREWDAIWRGVAQLIVRERETSLFPRISLERVVHAGTGPAESLVLALRACPPAREFTDLAVFDGADPRQWPQIKGPDIARLAEAKAAALAGATAGTTVADIILCASDGALLEASTGALVHWRGGSFVISDRFEQQLASVTLRQVYDRAQQLGTPVTFRPVFAAELGDGPLWFVNAVHGVSPVREVRLGGDPIAIPEHPEAAAWRDWWWSTLEPIAIRQPQDPAVPPHPRLA